MYKVLVIDDELMIKRSLSALIQRSGTDFEVVGEAEDGCEGLELARQHHPHLVLTDIRMPKLDGLELVEELNRLMPDVMTVLVSGYGEFDYAQHALRHGVFDYLLKPVKPHEVMRVLENAQNRLRQTESHRRERQDWLRVCRREGKRLADGIWNLDESAVQDMMDDVEALMKADSYVAMGRAEMYESLFQHVLQELDERETGGTELPGLKLARTAETGTDASEREDAVRESVTQHVSKVMETLRERRNFSRHYKIREAVDYVDRHFASPDTTLQLVAEKVEMSVSHFSRSFKEETGESFVQYVTRLRMEKAKKLLRDPLMKTYEVAEQVGYADYPHFSKTFKKYGGLSPIDYRNQMAASDKPE